MGQEGAALRPAWAQAAPAAGGFSAGATLAGPASWVYEHSGWVREASTQAEQAFQQTLTRRTSADRHPASYAKATTTGRCSKVSRQQLHSVVQCLHCTFCILQNRPGGVSGEAAAAAPSLAATAPLLPTSWAAGCAAATSCRRVRCASHTLTYPDDSMYTAARFPWSTPWRQCMLMCTRKGGRFKDAVRLAAGLQSCCSPIWRTDGASGRARWPH